MSTADAVTSTNLSVDLTRKGERFAEAESARLLAISQKKAIRREASAEVQKLLDILDRLDGDPDLEDGADDEPTMGWTGSEAAYGRHTVAEGEAEPALGWTSTVNQTSRNRLGGGEDYEKDDADKELEPDLEDGGDAEPDDDSEPDADTEGECVGASPRLRAHLRAIRKPAMPRGFRNVSPINEVTPELQRSIAMLINVQHGGTQGVADRFPQDQVRDQLAALPEPRQRLARARRREEARTVFVVDLAGVAKPSQVTL